MKDHDYIGYKRNLNVFSVEKFAVFKVIYSLC